MKRKLTIAGLGLVLAAALAVGAPDFFNVHTGVLLKFGPPIESTPTPTPTPLTNAQKLSLDPATSVGTQVAVSDGFYVSDAGSDEMNGFWFPSGTGFNNTVAYQNAAGGTCFLNEDPNQWSFYTSDGNFYTSAEGDTPDTPWLVTLWILGGHGANPLPTLTHPAIQRLAAPSTAQGGVFVAGGTQNGVYEVDGTVNGKNKYQLLGGSAGSQACYWFSGGSKWIILNGDPLYYSLEDVATPDLVTVWLKASDDTPALGLTVTSVTQGELDAGLTVAGAGAADVSHTVEVDGYYSVRGGAYGRNFYVMIGHDVAPSGGLPSLFGVYLFADPFPWAISDSEDNAGFLSSDLNTIFPWGLSWNANDSDPPAPTVTRNDVASEANWEAVP